MMATLNSAAIDSKSSTAAQQVADGKINAEVDAQFLERNGIDPDIPGSGASSSVDSTSEKLAPSAVYAQGGRSRFYEPIASYEGRHRWDPHAEWTEKEEKTLVRRVSSLFHNFSCSG